MDALLLLQPIRNKKSHDLRKAVGKWALPIAIDLSKNNYPTSGTHLTIQSEFPYQETLTNMDALLLLQPIRNKKSHDLRKAVGKWALPIAIDLSKNNYPTSGTHLTIQSELDALQLLQPIQLIQNKKSHQTSYF